jgi:hypothetical protein
MRRLALAVSAVALLAGCGPEAPASPSFEADVKPILVTHCNRCHRGGAMDPALAPPLLNVMPAQLFFDQYDVAAPLAPFMLGYIDGMITGQRMPPPPSDPLTSYEHDTFARWAAGSPPAP